VVVAVGGGCGGGSVSERVMRRDGQQRQRQQPVLVIPSTHASPQPQPQPQQPHRPTHLDDAVGHVHLLAQRGQPHHELDGVDVVRDSISWVMWLRPYLTTRGFFFSGSCGLEWVAGCGLVRVGFAGWWGWGWNGLVGWLIGLEGWGW